jgi:hypothetical protein
MAVQCEYTRGSRVLHKLKSVGLEKVDVKAYIICGLIAESRHT